MSKLFILLGVFCCFLSSAQNDVKIIKAILDSTSEKKNYAIIFNNSSNEKCFIWSNQLIESYKARGFSNAMAIKIIKEKLFNNDTFNIDNNVNINFDKIEMKKYEVVDKYKSLDSFLEVYFQNNQMKSIHSEYFKEVSYFLWNKGIYVYIGLDCGSLPCIGIFNNSQINNNRTKKILDKEQSKNNKYFFFEEYGIYLNVEKPDTSILNLKVNKTDVQSLTRSNYMGEFHFAKFAVNHNSRTIMVYLYNSSKELQQRRKYKYHTNYQLDEEQYFLSITSDIQTIQRMVTIPYQYDRE
jgi:hypothetical protein